MGGLGNNKRGGAGRGGGGVVSCPFTLKAQGTGRDICILLNKVTVDKKEVKTIGLNFTRCMDENKSTLFKSFYRPSQVITEVNIRDLNVKAVRAERMA